MVKNKIRKSLFEQGQSLSNNYKAKSDLVIQSTALKKINFEATSNILLYFPFRNEVASSMIVESLKTTSKNIYVPKIIDKQTMKFNLLSESSTMIRNCFGIQEIKNDKYISPSDFQVMFIPLVGVDLNGCRLGYGSGYFDRTLQFSKELEHRPLLVGLAYDYQICDEGFGEQHDLKYDIVISEKRFLKFS